jgi:hypothetical protein
MADNHIETIAAAMAEGARARDNPRARLAARARESAARRAATALFAELNGWRVFKEFGHDLNLLGRVASSRRDNRERQLLDHCVWFRGQRRYVAVVGQPYLSAVDLAEERASLARRGLVMHVPPDPFASFHYPGWTLFLIVTLPGVAVRWLPEQDGRLKGLWRDWLEDASGDYRTEAAKALFEAEPAP